MEHPAGESNDGSLRVDFDLRLKLEFHGSRITSDDAIGAPLVVVATERMDADPGWRMLASGELIHVDGDLRVHRRRILEGEPAHRLTLADLSAAARASQAPVPAPAGAGEGA